MLFCISSYCQSDSDNLITLRDSVEKKSQQLLTFKGIELKSGLSMKELLNQLESKGFKKSEMFDYGYENFNIYTLDGTFFGSSNCEIKILPTANNKNIVGVIGVQFPIKDSFAKLSEQYYNLKAALQKKYTLYKCDEYFKNSLIDESTDDFIKLNALSEDEGEFNSTFRVPNDEMGILGFISLLIGHVKLDYRTVYFVMLSYSTSDGIIASMTREDDL